MNADIRLAVGFFQHKKTVRLQRKLGDRGIICLLKMWEYIAVNKPRGDLSGFDVEDIEIAAGWDGEPGAFFAAITDEKCRWLDEIEPGHFEAHNWEKHNGWAAHAEQRSEHARWAARKRWGLLNDAPGNAPSMPNDAPGNAPTPSPSPSPSPKKKDIVEREDSQLVDEPEKPDSQRFDDTDLRLAELLSELMTENNPSRKVETDAQRRRWANEARLMRERDARPIDEIEEVIRFSQEDGFWKSNILSMKTLRKQYDRLLLRMKSEEDGSFNRRPPPNLFHNEDEGLPPGAYTMKNGKTVKMEDDDIESFDFNTGHGIEKGTGRGFTLDFKTGHGRRIYDDDPPEVIG